MAKPPVVFCRDCKHSEADRTSPWQLRCHNPDVNRHDSWALASSEQGRGTDCHTERRYTGWFSKCGIKGKLYEPKEQTQ